MRDNADRSGGEDGTLENSLPQPFVESMRTLFDILDDQHTGRVKFSDIERRWHEDEDCTTSGLPPGVLESLRVVTPQDGYLSFSRFCKGLQICLLRSKSGNPGLTPTSLASSAQSSPSSGGETSRPPDHQRASGSLISSREEAPPPIPPPPSHQAYQAPQLPYISHPNSGSLKNQDFNGNRKLSNPNYTSTGWLPQKTKPGSGAQPVGLYGGGSMYDVKKSIDGPIYQQHTLLSNNKYHLNGLSHHGDSSRENRNNNVPPSTQIQSFHVSGSNIRAAPLNSPLKNGSKSSNGSSSSSSNGENSSNSRSGFGVQVQKSDIRMGTGGMMSVYGSKVTSSSNTYSKSSHGVASSQGPPKPPRSLESQNSDNNLNSVDKFNGKSNGSLNQQVRQSNSSHRVDSIINKMEALNTYATSSNTNNSNIHKEKIYDSIASKNRQGVAPVTNGFYVSSNTKSSNSSNQTHPYRKESGQSRQDDADYDHWSSERIKRGSSKPSGSSSSSNGSRAPAALPLSAVLNGYSLQRSQTHSHITTHSLERDSRADARRVSQDSNPGSRVRTRRGGSLERLLDDHNNHNQHQYFHHHHHHQQLNGGVPRHHHHSRESSNDTSSTAPLHSYHSSADWSVSTALAPSSTSLTSTSSSTNTWNTTAAPSMVNKNIPAAGGSVATFSQRFQHQPQKTAPQYPTQQVTRKSSHQPSSPTKNNSNSGGGGPFVANLAPNTSHKSSAAVKYSMVTGNNGSGSSSTEGSPRRSSTDARHPSNMAARSASGGGTTTTAGPAFDNRLLMSSYAWIRGGEDTSSNSGDGGYHSSNATFGAPTGGAPLPPPPNVPLPPENEEVGVAGSGEAGTNGAGGANGSRAHKKSRRRDARRHTLQNGLDYAVVRRAGELEAERDMLHQGLQVVEQARQWYRTQLHNLLYNLHHNTHSVQPYDSEAQQQKLHYQLARITEINSQLTALMNASDMPHHLALASSTSAAPAGTTAGSMLPAADGSADKQDKSKMQGQVKRLKDQNQQLTEEVSIKSQHISVLEQDKSRLLRELFQARTVSAGSLQSNGQADSTFM